MLGMSLSSSFLPLLANNLDPSGILVGLVVSAWFISRIFMEVPAGIISDRVGRRKLFLIGVGLSVLGSFLCAQARTIYILILGRSVWGFGAALFFMNSTALIIDLFEYRFRYLLSIAGLGHVGYQDFHDCTSVLFCPSIGAALPPLRPAQGGIVTRTKASL